MRARGCRRRRAMARQSVNGVGEVSVIAAHFKSDSQPAGEHRFNPTGRRRPRLWRGGGYHTHRKEAPRLIRLASQLVQPELDCIVRNLVTRREFLLSQSTLLVFADQLDPLLLAQPLHRLLQRKRGGSPHFEVTSTRRSSDAYIPSESVHSSCIH
jgi:hypothetical protein